MATNWSQECCESLSNIEREADGFLNAQPKSPIPKSTAPIDRSFTNRVGAESLPAAGYPKWKFWFIVWGVMLTAVMGVVILHFLNVASFGVLGFAVTVAGSVAAVGLGHLLWGRVFARRISREMHDRP
jgi:hypothetical protein